MFSKFCSAQSKDHLRQFWENWTDFQGGVAKRRCPFTSIWRTDAVLENDK